MFLPSAKHPVLCANHLPLQTATTTTKSMNKSNFLRATLSQMLLFEVDGSRQSQPPKRKTTEISLWTWLAMPVWSEEVVSAKVLALVCPSSDLAQHLAPLCLRLFICKWVNNMFYLTKMLGSFNEMTCD